MDTARTAIEESAVGRGRGSRAASRAAIALGAAILVALVALDIVLAGSSATIAGAMLLAPFATAIYGGARSTAVIAAAATALAALSFTWQGGDIDAGQLARVAIVGLGSAFAVFAATARDRAELRARWLELLDALGDIAVSADTPAVVERIGAMLTPAVADVCTIDVVQPDGGIRRLLEAGAPGTDRARLAEASPPAAWVSALASGPGGPARPIVIEDLGSPAPGVPERMVADLNEIGLDSAIAVPLSVRGETRGSLLLASAGRRFTDADEGFAAALAGRIALVLENAGLSRELSGVASRLRSVVSLIDESVLISDASGRIVFVNAAAEALFGLDGEAEMIGSDRAELLGRFETRDEAGTSVDARGLFSPGADGTAARLALPGRPEVWARVRTRRVAGPSGEPDHLLTTIEDQSDVRRAAFAQSLLARTGGLLVHSTAYRETLDEVARLVVGELADHCSINVPGEGGVIEQVAVANIDTRRRAAAIQMRERYPVSRDDDHAISEVLRTGEPILMPDAADWSEQRASDDTERMLIREVGNGSCLIVPMVSGERIVGTMWFANREGGRAFGEFDLEIATALGLRAGEAIENARVATERARVAEILQGELLPPRLPGIEGWKVASMYHPAGEVNQVGGDFYDAFEVGDSWAVVLGDVVGRGASAASLTAEARHTLRTALVLSADPGRALELLDAGFRRRAGARLCSVVVAILDGGHGSNRLRVWSAGHPLPLLVRRGSAFEIGEPGPLLGIDLEPAWPETEVEFEEGDQLVLYTDGVIEARGEQERFGIGRMRATVASASEPAEAIAAIESALRRFLPEELDDDAAMIVLQRAGATAARSAQGRGGGAVGRTL